MQIFFKNCLRYTNPCFAKVPAFAQMNIRYNQPLFFFPKNTTLRRKPECLITVMEMSWLLHTRLQMYAVLFYTSIPEMIYFGEKNCMEQKDYLQDSYVAPPQLPQAINVLSILSFIGSAFQIVSSIVSYFVIPFSVKSVNQTRALEKSRDCLLYTSDAADE